MVTFSNTSLFFSTHMRTPISRKFLTFTPRNISRNYSVALLIPRSRNGVFISKRMESRGMVFRNTSCVQRASYSKQSSSENSGSEETSEYFRQLTQRVASFLEEKQIADVNPDNMPTLMAQLTQPWTKRQKYIFLRDVMLKCSYGLYAQKHETEWIQNAFCLEDKEQAKVMLARARIEKRSGIRIPFSAAAKTIITDWIKTHPGAEISSEDKAYLMKRTGLGSHQFAEVFGKLTETPGVVTVEKKRIIKDWLRANDDRRPTRSERQYLSDCTGLSRTQINTQLRVLRERKGRVTQKKKMALLRWLKENDFRSPTTEERDNLGAMLRLTRDQVSQQLSHLTDAKGEITDEVKTFIRQWLEANDHRSPTKEELYHLLQHTGLNRAQVRNLIPTLKRPRGILDKSKKEFIAKWLQENNNKYPNALDMEWLMDQTQLSFTQLKSQLYAFKYPSRRKVTREAKEIIRSWLQEHGGSIVGDISSQDVSHLMNATGLTRQQVHGQLRQFRDTHGTLTQEKQDTVLNWLRENDFRSPTREERDEIQRKTDLGRAQLNYQLFFLTKKFKGMDAESVIASKSGDSSPSTPVQKKFARKYGVLSDETKGIIARWLQENSYRSPTSAERDALQKQTKLGRDQLNFQLYYLTKKHEQEWKRSAGIQ